MKKKLWQVTYLGIIEVHFESFDEYSDALESDQQFFYKKEQAMFEAINQLSELVCDLYLEIKKLKENKNE